MSVIKKSLFGGIITIALVMCIFPSPITNCGFSNNNNGDSFPIIADEIDSDEDGLSDALEAYYGTDRLNPDSDYDVINDFLEIMELHSDPLDNDTDDDFLIDGAEYFSYHTDIFDNDTDDDGIMDGIEVEWKLDPKDPDTDHDELTDYDEIYIYFTNPRYRDIDEDKLIDSLEIFYGLDPFNPDEDDDGLLDGIEIQKGTDPFNPDTDGDGFIDSKDFGPKTKFFPLPFFILLGILGIYLLIRFIKRENPDKKKIQEFFSRIENTSSLPKDEQYQALDDLRMELYRIDLEFRSFSRDILISKIEQKMKEIKELEK